MDRHNHRHDTFSGSTSEDRRTSHLDCLCLSSLLFFFFFFILITDTKNQQHNTTKQKCLQMSNYMSTWTLLQALLSSTILGLKRTWGAVGPKFMTSLREMLSYLSVTQNSKDIVKQIAEEGICVIPDVEELFKELNSLIPSKSRPRIPMNRMRDILWIFENIRRLPPQDPSSFVIEPDFFESVPCLDWPMIDRFALSVENPFEPIRIDRTNQIIFSISNGEFNVIQGSIDGLVDLLVDPEFEWFVFLFFSSSSPLFLIKTKKKVSLKGTLKSSC